MHRNKRQDRGPQSGTRVTRAPASQMTVTMSLRPRFHVNTVTAANFVTHKTNRVGIVPRLALNGEDVPFARHAL